MHLIVLLHSLILSCCLGLPMPSLDQNVQMPSSHHLHNKLSIQLNRRGVNDEEMQDEPKPKHPEEYYQSRIKADNEAKVHFETSMETSAKRDYTSRGFFDYAIHYNLMMAVLRPTLSSTEFTEKLNDYTKEAIGYDPKITHVLLTYLKAFAHDIPTSLTLLQRNWFPDQSSKFYDEDIKMEANDILEFIFKRPQVLSARYFVNEIMIKIDFHDSEFSERQKYFEVLFDKTTQYLHEHVSRRRQDVVDSLPVITRNDDLTFPFSHQDHSIVIRKSNSHSQHSQFLFVFPDPNIYDLLLSPSFFKKPWKQCLKEMDSYFQEKAELMLSQFKSSIALLHGNSIFEKLNHVSLATHPKTNFLNKLFSLVPESKGKEVHFY